MLERKVLTAALNHGAVPPIGSNRLLLATSTSLTGFHKSHGTQLRTTHHQPRPIMRGLIIESTYAPTLAPAGKAIVLAALVGFLWRNVCTTSSPLNYFRKRGAFATPYKSTLRHFPHAKYNSTSHIRHVATELSEIVGSLRNSIIRTKIVLCMGIAAYSDVQ